MAFRDPMMVRPPAKYFRFKHLFFSHTTSLGDAIVLSPIIRRYAKEAEFFYLEVSETYLQTLKCLYQDDPHIHVVDKNGYDNLKKWLESKGEHWNEMNALGTVVHPTEMLCGDGKQRWIDVNWERQHYESLEIPYSVRYTEFKIPSYVEGADELKQRLTDGAAEYAVVSRYWGSENTFININVEPWTKDLKVVEIIPGQTDNMLQYLSLLKDAKQIHVVPSALFCLIDSITEQMNGMLFLHNIRASYISQVNSRWNDAVWTTVIYPTVL